MGPSARTVLLDAALSADRQPVTKGRYWYVDSRIRWLQKVKAAWLPDPQHGPE